VSFKTERDLVKNILLHAPQYEWSLQGFGMFRLYLSRERRLHVWDSRFTKHNVSTIHNHPWDFASTVISGSLVDVSYKKIESYQFATHHRLRIVCGPGGGPASEPDTCFLKKFDSRLILPGESYALAAKQIHETKPADGSITIIERRFREDTEHAEVFYPVLESWVSAEPRPATQDEIAMMSAKALRVLDDEIKEEALRMVTCGCPQGFKKGACPVCDNKGSP